MTCSTCLRDLEADSRYCRFCGARTDTSRPVGRRLARRPADGRLGGVCAGLAAYADTDVTFVRLAWVLLSIVPGALLGGVIAYAVAWVLLPAAAPDEPYAFTGRRLARSRRDRMAAGVCGGLAEYFGIDPTIVRLIAAALAIYPGAVVGGAVVYLLAWIVIPSETDPVPVTADVV